MMGLIWPTARRMPIVRGRYGVRRNATDVPVLPARKACDNSITAR
jgi:hypothetical protein